MKRASLHLFGAALVTALSFGAAAGASAKDPALPIRAPVPPSQPVMEQFGPPMPPKQSPPIPTPRPGSDTGPAASAATPEPADHPSRPEDEAEPETPEKKFLADERTGRVPARTLPEAELACRKRLDGLGVAFRNETALSSPDGCSLPYPVTVRRLGTIDLEPPATMDCAMAEAAGRFMSGPAQEFAKAAYGKGIKTVGQASAYVCRPRNGTVKLSEHAFGNALDIASVTLEDGTVLTVGSTGDAKAIGVLEAIRKAACGPFKTVLGPGSDADHATHLHLDLAPRRNGSLFCQ